MSRKKKINALILVMVWEITILLIICKWILIPIIALALIYSIHYTYKYYLWLKEREKKKKRQKRRKQCTNLEKSLQVQSNKAKKTTYRATSSLQEVAGQESSASEMSITAKSICGAPIALDEINDIDGETFETILYNRFKSLHFTVYFTATSGDFGADLIVEMEGLSVAIQCKRYNYKAGRTVGVKAVQEVLGAMYYYGAKRGMVITNAVYTQNAKELARSVGNITLWDREDLKKYMNFI